MTSREFMGFLDPSPLSCTAVSSEVWAKLRDWASVAGKGRLLLSGSIVLASLKAAVQLATAPRFRAKLRVFHVVTL